jgi:hypothetical protein
VKSEGCKERVRGGMKGMKIERSKENRIKRRM